MIQQYQALYEKGGDWWIGSVIELPGALAQGRTVEEVRENLIDAIREVILARRELAEAEIRGKPDVVREQLTIQIDS
jgi:predicted RNase H-like HicB family nuclease